MTAGFTELMDTKCLPSTPQSTAITCNSQFLIGTETRRNTMIEETRRPIYFHSRPRSWKPAHHQPACTTGFPTVARHSGRLAPSLPWLLDCASGRPQKAPAGTEPGFLCYWEMEGKYGSCREQLRQPREAPVLSELITTAPCGRGSF